MIKLSEPSDIGDYISELFAERWRHHNRAILRHTLIGMVGGQVVNARSLSTKYSIPESKVSAAFATDRYDLNGSGDVVDVFGVGIAGQLPFEFQTQESTLNICCALVSVMMSQLTPGQNTILSVDPVSKSPIKVISGPSGATSYPNGAVIVLVAPSIDEFCQDQWNSFCKYVRFYESEENASLGSRQASPAVQLSVQELSGIAQSLSDTLWP